MKKYWYLVASLPSLRLGEKPPMDAAAFRAACAGHLSDDEMAAVDALLERRAPPAGIASMLWDSEIQLRNAVVRIRAKNRAMDAARFIRPHEGFSVFIEERVSDAFARSNPLERAMALDHIRWTQADELAKTDAFGFAAVLAFAAQVRIAGYWAGLNDEEGRKNVEELILAAVES